MKITDIAVHAGGIDQPYKTLGEITAKVSKAALFSSSRTIEDVNFKLQEEPSALGEEFMKRHQELLSPAFRPEQDPLIRQDAKSHTVAIEILP